MLIFEALVNASLPKIKKFFSKFFEFFSFHFSTKTVVQYDYFRSVQFSCFVSSQRTTQKKHNFEKKSTSLVNVAETFFQFAQQLSSLG